MYYFGLDIGSVTVKVVVLDEGGIKREAWYTRHAGHPLPTAYRLLSDVLSRYPDGSLSVTGSGGKILCRMLGIKTTNEVVAQAYSVKRLYPQINTILELGGEDSKLIIMDQGRVTDFAMNSVCAAGTGSFLEQQAERLRLTIEEFSEMAARSLRPSKIAGRCSVFAKSDMIHLQQIATPVEDIVAGLCVAVARNFKGTIAKGRDMRPPVAFQGGVAANRGMVKAFRDVFGLDDLFIPPDYALMGALGAALKDRDEGRVSPFDLSALSDYLAAAGYREEGHRPLIQDSDGFHERHGVSDHAVSAVSGGSVGLSSGRVTAYLGIDIGSISTNLAVIDERGRLLAKQYLMTAGRPIEAVQQGLDAIYSELGDGVAIEGVGTTGSGRYMIADFVGADIVKNEITAQATAAIFIDPSVDTIFEIGGQDSKYISIRDGIIIDFEMNKACAAGTGSFIEEQAEKLDISVKGEFAKLAFAAPNPCRLGERCTVFMENSLMANLQRGAQRDDLLAGLAYSIVQNYINRVVAGKHVGERIFFQGGVAFNKAVVAAFEKYLDREITVPPHHDVTGAIGMALIARDHMKTHEDRALSLGRTASRTQFKGFELSRRSYEIDSFECRGCPNVCEINKVKIRGEEGNLFYGGRCEKYDVRQHQGTILPDLFSFREERLWDAYRAYHSRRPGAADEAGRQSSPGSNGGNGSRSPRARLGIPYIFYFHDLLPFWTTLLEDLNFEVVVSPRTNKQIVNLGVENVLSEACFPVKVAHGHISFLRNTGVDAIFNPSFINLNQEFDEYLRGLACPHTQTIPYVSKVAIRGIEMISPVIDKSRGTRFLEQELMRILKRFGVGRGELQRALGHARMAQESFRDALKAKGKEVLDQYGISLWSGEGQRARDGEGPMAGEPLIVIVGRAYNAFDPGVNLQIPKKLAQIGTLAVPMDFLILRDVPLKESWPDMYWRSGQRMLKAARIIRNTPRLYPIFIGNFSCGPDSFILKYFREEMGEKPFLHVEIDEHSADAGAVTRCEAFLDSITQQMQSRRGPMRTAHPVAGEGAEKMTVRRGRSEIGTIGQRTVYIPRMADHTLAVQAAFESCGVPAEVLPESDKESVELGRRYVSGKECYPYLITAGDMLKKISSPEFRPESSAFFMPSGTGPCRFGQYNIGHKLILEKLGLTDVPIFAPMQDKSLYRELGMVGNDFIKRVWKGVIAYELLTKCLHETRPFEASRGDADHAYGKYLREIYKALRNGGGEMDGVLARLRRDFMAIPVRKERRPVIGVVGEIFVRSHRFSNEDLVRKIEALGGQVWLAPLEEWIHYVNAISLRSALIKRDKSAIMNILVKRFYQRQIEHKSARPFEEFLHTLREPGTREILDKASRYVHDSFEGETVLSVGKAVDLIERGASGIINAMPFGCMPGTIVTAFMKAISSDYGVPCISIPYDGTESSVTELQLEAFMETVLTNFRDIEKESMRR